MTYRNYDVHLQRTTVERARVPIRAQSVDEASGMALACGKDWQLDTVGGVTIVKIDTVGLAPEPKIPDWFRESVERMRAAGCTVNVTIEGEDIPS